MGKIKQNFKNMPLELLEQKRMIPVKDDKKPRISEWQKSKNQSLYDEITPPVAFVISSGETEAEDYLVFDFDHIFDADGNFVTEQAGIVCEKIWNDMGETFVEYSQSGRGLHFFTKPTAGKFNPMSPVTLYLDDKTNTPTNERAKLEVFYKSARYFILTGNLFEDGVKTIASGEPVDIAVNNILEIIKEQKAIVGEKDNLKNTPSNDNSKESPIDIDRAKAMLQYIDPTELSYDEWLNVGMVLKNIGAPFEMWDEWSKEDSERYNQKGQSCEKKWNGFKDEGELTIATLHDLAKSGGYKEHDFQKEWRKEHSDKISFLKSNAEILPINMGEYLKGQYEDDLKGFRSVSKLNTGFQNLDEAIDGVGPGLYILGAVPSLGKTTLMHQMADNMAKAGEHVLYFSLEQEPFELASKSIARESYLLEPEAALTEWGLQRGYDDPNKHSLTQRALLRYREAIDDKLTIIPGIHNVSIEYITHFVEDFIENTGNRPVVIIDYLQKITADGKFTDKQRIDYITSSLKQLQSRNGIALFVISSFNRTNYMQVADFESFKESGDIEYSADAVWALQLQIMNSPELTAQDSGRDSTTKSQKRIMVELAKNENPRRIELKALKHRGHRLYRVGFLFHGAHSYFESDPSYNRASHSNNERNAEERPIR